MAAPRRAALAAMLLFLLFGVLYGSWVSRIPAVQNGLSLNDAELGVALLSMSVGAILAMPITGLLLRHLGNRQVVRVASVLLPLGLPFIIVTASQWQLALVLLIFGMVFGMVDVSVNAYAVALEARLARPIMSTMHGLFSLGGLIGAGGTIAAASQGLEARPQFLAVAIAVSLLSLLLGLSLIDIGGRDTSAPVFVMPSRSLLGLGLFAFCVLLSEGAIADWSAVYLENVLGATASVAASGYAAFSIAIAACRFGGDPLTQRFGAVTVVRVGCLIAAAGMALAVLGNTVPTTMAGFALVGAGLAATFPTALSAAGRTPGMAPGMAIGAVATAGYAGLLTGPPIIGFISNALNLRMGMALVIVLCVAGALLAGTTKR
ncbi:MAG: MFS transporter [Thermomicrobiales bacterium]|nr:MFS transporter [Thermomicrobiales bacterium]